MRRLPVLLLIGTLGLGALAACGDDESRRTGAIDQSALLSLALTVVTQPNSGFVTQNQIYNGRRTGGTSGISCTGAAAPGTTCTWTYQRVCNVDDPDCTVAMKLIASPEAGAHPLWEGCSSPALNACTVELPATVKVTFVSKTSQPNLSLAVASQTGASGSVAQDALYNVTRAGGTPGTSCVAVAEPGRTCGWEYLQACPGGGTNCLVSMRLWALPTAGSQVLWEGCTSSGASACNINLPGSVRATFVSKASLPKLALTVVRQGNASGSVKQSQVVNGRRADSPSATCVAAAEPGATCDWDYVRACATGQPANCVVSTFLSEAPAPGTIVNWTGCTRTGTHATGEKFCQVDLAGTVRATFVPDPKG